MTFVALRFDAGAAAAEAWAAALLAAGALSVDVADARAGTAAENPVYGGEPRAVFAGWPVTRLTALFTAGIDAAAAFARAGAELGLIVPEHTLEPIPDDDWLRRTQAQFRPLHVSNRLWIVPSWSRPIDDQAINLSIDPGLAFGTGSHATTRLCLRWLDACFEPGGSLLDYGCGSGILAIAAAKLGAATVTGVDIDVQALETSRANARANAVKGRFRRAERLPSAVFDAVVANILANPLVQLAPRLARRVRTDGDIVLSGILESQSAPVAAAYARWFNIGVWGREDGWVALAGSRKHDHA